MTSSNRKRGTALISALLIVTVMSAVAVELLGDMRFAIARSGNLSTRDQAYWYALGARDYAENLLGRVMQPPDAALRPDAPWLHGPRQFPIEGGMIEARLRDGHTCFNINSLVTETEPGRYTTNPDAVAQLDTLLTMVGLPPVTASLLSAEAADWIDSDTRPGPGGAEDFAYAGLDIPYRPANTLMVEVEEVRALRSMTPDLYTVAAPHLCALPVAGSVPININTLVPGDAVQLAARFSAHLSRADAEAILLRRPSGGYAAEADFWADQAFAGRELDAGDFAQITRRSTWFDIRVRVEMEDARFHLDAGFEVGRGGVVTRHGQRFGSLS
tara:strand:- start:1424 stop:2410 length:987 start_codon:yes stop_codon:yes gene_type:complete